MGVEGGGGDGDAVDDFVGAFAGVLAGVFVVVLVVVVDVGVVLFLDGLGGDELGVLVGEEEADALVVPVGGEGAAAGVVGAVAHVGAGLEAMAGAFGLVVVSVG